jgi:hypothetical protein
MILIMSQRVTLYLQHNYEFAQHETLKAAICIEKTFRKQLTVKKASEQIYERAVTFTLTSTNISQYGYSTCFSLYGILFYGIQFYFIYSHKEKVHIRDPSNH